MIMLHDLIECMKGGRIVHSGFKPTLPLRNNAPEIYTWLLSETASAICFDAGDSADVPPLRIIPELFKAPYPNTWIETKTQEGGIVGVLVVTKEDEIVIAVLQRRGIPVWEFIAAGEMFDEGGDLHVTKPAPTDNQMLDEQVADFLVQSATFVARLFMAMNCSNVQAIEHKAPKLINKQRAKKGKQPIYSYWTLHLPNASACGGNSGGTHASPRIHLRRGHIRQFSPGRYTWVQACVVGNKESGVVEKDYAIHCQQ